MQFFISASVFRVSIFSTSLVFFRYNLSWMGVLYTVGDRCIFELLIEGVKVQPLSSISSFFFSSSTRLRVSILAVERLEKKLSREEFMRDVEVSPR